MLHNQILGRLRYALDLSDDQVIEAFRLGGLVVDHQTARSLQARCSHADFVECSSEQLTHFLNGVIVLRRGPPTSPRAPEPLTNNGILKKVRIALDLKEDAMLAIFEKGGVTLTRRELGALFRRPDHRNFRSVKAKLLDRFLIGLSATLRPPEPGPAPS